MGKLTDKEMAELKALRKKKSGLGASGFNRSASASFDSMGAKKPVDPNAPGMLESGLRGAAQGATFGFADEIAGTAQGAFQTVTGSGGDAGFLDLIQKNINAQREADAAAREANPMTFGASEFVTGAAKDLLIPGAAGVRGLKGVAAIGAGLGSLESAGRADSIADIPKDMVIGAVLGGVGGPGLKIAGKALKGIGTAGRRKLGELGVTGRLLGKEVSEDEDIFMRLATQGKREIASSYEDFQSNAAAFAKANKLREKATGKGYVRKIADGYGVEVVAEEEARKFGGLRKAARAQRARVSGDLPNDLSLLSKQMTDRMIKLSNTKKGLLRQAGQKIKNKTFSLKNLGLKDELTESNEFLLAQPKGAKLKKILSADKKLLSFQEINDLEEYVSGLLKNSWKNPIDTSVEKSLKGIRKSLVETQRDQVERALGKNIGAKNRAIYEELSATIDSSQEIFKAKDQLFRAGSKSEGRIGKPIVESFLGEAGQDITPQGGVSARGIIGRGASAISAGLQTPIDVAGQVIDSGAAIIGSSEAVKSLTSNLFPKGTLEENGKVSLTDPMEKKMARHYNDQLPLRERSKANLLLNSKGEFDPNNVPKPLKKKYMKNAPLGLGDV
jgi:hypothetical protein